MTAHDLSEGAEVAVPGPVADARPGHQAVQSRTGPGGHPNPAQRSPHGTVGRDHPSAQEDEPHHRIDVAVRWWDGYLERFAVDEIRAGSDLLWMRLANGRNRHIPLRGVRWWSLSEESHEQSEAG